MAENFSLPKGVVEVRYLAKEKGMIKDPKHVAYGGLMRGSTIKLPANVLRNGKFKNVLTKEEKEYLEKVLSLGKDGLSVYNKDESSYWKTFSVTLGKDPIRLNKEDPEDYIKYKQLKSYINLIAPNLASSEPGKALETYKFVLIEPGDESKVALAKFDVTKEAYKFYGKIEDNRKAMVDYLGVINVKVSPDTSVDALKAKIGEEVATNPKRFVETLNDESYATRVLLYQSQVAGYIIKKGNHYFSKDGEPLAEPNQQSTLENVIAYLEANMNQEYRVILQTKLEEQAKGS